MSGWLGEVVSAVCNSVVVCTFSLYGLFSLSMCYDALKHTTTIAINVIRIHQTKKIYAGFLIERMNSKNVRTIPI